MTVTTHTDVTIESGDTLTTRDEVNDACIDQALAIRAQPKAPNPTEYFVHENGQWFRGKHHRYSDRGIVERIDVDAVREIVDDYAPRGQVMAVEVEESPFHEVSGG